MTDINKVFLVGRIVRDADLRFTNAGTPVAKFSIAVNKSRKNGDKWEDEVNYLDIVLWGKVAESLSKYLLKGKQIAVEGELRQNRWEQEGQHRSKVEIRASNIQLLGGEKSQNATANSNNGYSNQSYNNNSPQGQESANQQSFEQFDDDGIPF